MSLLTKFTTAMFLRSSYGDAELAAEKARKTADFYKDKMHENKIAYSRYMSAIDCEFLLRASIK